MRQEKEHKNPLTFEEFVHATYSSLLKGYGAEVFLRRHYLGKSGHNHEIDVSARLRIAGADLLLLIECKCYKKRVGVYDILAFAQRIDDIGAQKGIMVSKVGYQDGAVKLATSKNIALVVSENQEYWEHVRYHGISKNGEKIGPPPPTSFKRVVPTVKPINIKDFYMITATSLDRAWRSIINYSVDPTGDLGFNHEAVKLKVWRAKAEAKHRSNIEFLERKRIEVDPLSESHSFPLLKEVCEKCGNSMVAVLHFGWWKCHGKKE